VNRTSWRRAIVPGIAALALALSACGDDADGDSGSDATVDGDLSGELAVGGASSQEAAQNAWIVGFGELAPDVTVTYDPVGSGGGRENFISGGYAFAGSDAYLTDDEGELTAATENCGGDPIEVPNYVSPIAIIYNVEGVDDLQLSPEALAGIFAGSITTWDDPAIAETNPDADLPSDPINAVHRSDESGTTENFTDYLDAVAGDTWTEGVVETWPSSAGGEGAKGTSGVVKVVTDSTNTIGYADASQAGELSQALIGVGEEFVAPSADAAASVLDVSPRVEGRPEVDMAFDLDHATTEAGVYPIVLTSYLLACQQYDDENTAALVKGYLSYVLSEDGQTFAAEEAGSAPLSDTLREEALSIVENISAG
jgi:phosphate transport system substrate-binding protein